MSTSIGAILGPTDRRSLLIYHRAKWPIKQKDAKNTTYTTSITSGGPSTPADPAVAGGRQPQGGARRAPPWGILRNKGEKTQGRPKSARWRAPQQTQGAPFEGRFSWKVKKIERKWNSEMIMRMPNNQLSYWQSNKVQMDISEKSA